MSGLQSTLDGEVNDDDNRRIAEELAAEQQQISIAKFFEKNKHMLGFDSDARAIVTAVKEAVDNALDAAEQAQILPEVNVTIEEEGEYYRLTVEDNGPGIPKSNLPNVFGSLLFGSRFNSRSQARGQQGIGISAAVMHSQQTSGKPAKITSKTGRGEADYYELKIDTDENEPDIQKHEKVEWDEKEHGTRIVLEMEANMRGRKRLHEYIRNTAVVNPHATVTLEEPKWSFTSERATEQIPTPPEEIQPHPHGVDLGTLQDMLKLTDSYSVSGFLQADFTRVGQKTADDINGLFRDFYYGREFRISTDTLEKDEFTDALYDSISRKSQEAKEQLSSCIATDVLNQEAISYTVLERLINECADTAEDDHNERIGDTVRENIVDEAWSHLRGFVGETVHMRIDEATSKRKDDEAVEAFAEKVTDELFNGDNDRDRLKSAALHSTVESVAEAIRSSHDEAFGDTSKENIIDALWDQTDRVDTEMPNVKEVLKNRPMTQALWHGMQNANVMAPPMKCLSPITEDLIEAGMREVYDDADFYAASQREGGVTKGSPFIVEAGLAYGGDLQAEGKINLQRFGNKVPLVYQPGACIITQTVEGINWRNYNLSQPGGRGLPEGPIVLLVHVASTNIPFTSESKDAIASVPEIEHEVEQAVRMVARKLKSYLSERQSLQKRKQKQDVIGKIIPPMTDKFAESLTKPRLDSTQSIGKVMNNLTVFCKTTDNNGRVILENNSSSGKEVTVQLHCPKSPHKLADGYRSIDVDDGAAYEWTVSVAKDETQVIEVTSSAIDDSTVYISGIEEERTTYNTSIESIDTEEIGLIPVKYGSL